VWIPKRKRKQDKKNMFFVQLFFASVLLAAAKSEDGYPNLNSLEDESPLSKLQRILSGYKNIPTEEEIQLNRYRQFLADLIFEFNDLCSVYQAIRDKGENDNFRDQSE
jgi:hypothetical protein